MIVRLLNRTPIDDFVVNRLKLPNTELVNHRIQQVTRILVFLFSAWVGWQILNSHPDISEFIIHTGQAILSFVQLPIVIFTFDLALIGLETFVLIKITGWVKAGFQVIANRIRAEQNKRLKGFKLQRVQMFTASQLTRFLLVFSRYARYAVNILLILIYLTGVFSVFPQTRGVVNNTLTSIFQVIKKGWWGFVGYLPSLVNLIVIIVITYYGLKLIRFLFSEVDKGTITLSGFHSEWAIPTYQWFVFW